MDARTLAALGATLIFWASAFAGIRAGLESYPPGQLALFRFLVASTMLIVYAALTRMRMPEVRDLPSILTLGFLGITVYHVALVYGETTVTAGAASLLIASGPVFTAFLAKVFLGEHLSIYGWLGITVSFFGVALVAFGEGEGVRFDQGAFLILVSAFSTSLYFVFQKPYLKKYSAFQFTAYTIWAGTFFMMAFLPGLMHSIQVASLDATLAVVYLGVFPAALAYVTWTYALSRVPASIATSFLYLSPVLAILIAWLWLGEIPFVLSMIGGFLSLLGVVLLTTRGR
ncbi:MAG: DMT family transporter [Candidatus Bathyarchaeota archaeon]|nr:MAG: DMT family transporter [Candidatus Bathyarchaeota archaeon]